jgi:hypothetical protein
MKSLILFFILLFITFNEQLKTEDEILIYDKYYYKFSEVQNSLKNINYKIDKNLDLVEINGNNKKINFLLNSNYYSLGDYVFTSYTRNKYINNELYISDEVLSCILNNLISEDYSKTKNINKIFLKIYKKIHITAEEISLKNIIIVIAQRYGEIFQGNADAADKFIKAQMVEWSKLVKSGKITVD